MEKKLAFGFLFCCSVVFAGNGVTENSSILKDSRDGQSYKTVTIGNHVWMAQNLNYKFGGSMCYGNDEANCQKYGRLYNWNASKNVCPAGWHLPSLNETEGMVNFIGGKETAAKLLKSKTDWNGQDAYGFNVYPSGICDVEGSCSNMGTHGFIWNSTAETFGGAVWFFNGTLDSTGHSGFNRGWHLPVRCINDTLLDVPGYMTDSRDGRMYKTVDLGEFIWMAENLKYIQYGKEGYSCYRDNDSNCDTYGVLYSFTVAQKEACPAGWEPPHKRDVQRIMNLMDDGFTKALKPVAAGMKTADGKYMSMDTYGYFWTADNVGKKKGDYFYWSPKKNEVKWLVGNQMSSLSLRCVKRNKKPQVEQGTFKDTRDQKTYKTVTIGGDTWFAENLNFATAKSLCYENNASNCDKYGRLYNFEDATTACPAGWHLGSLVEFNLLFDRVSERECKTNCLYALKKDGTCEGGIGTELCNWLSAGKNLSQYGFSTEQAGFKYDYIDEEKNNTPVNHFEKGLIMWGGTYKNRAGEPVNFKDGKTDISPSFNEGGCYGECESNFYSVRCVKD